MKLKDYLYFGNIKRVEFADLIGISTMQLYRIIKGLAKPSLEMALKIRMVTEGKVSLEDLGVEMPPGISID